MPNHIPVRTCVGCFKRWPKQDLVRIIRTKNGQAEMAENLGQNGRGVYLCRKKMCLEKALNRKGRDGLSHGLKIKIDQNKILDLKNHLSALVN